MHGIAKKAAAIYNTTNTTNDHWAVEEEGIIDALQGLYYDFKYGKIIKHMSGETKKEAERLYPKYQKYRDVKFKEDAEIAVEKMQEKCRRRHYSYSSPP